MKTRGTAVLFTACTILFLLFLLTGGLYFRESVDFGKYRARAAKFAGSQEKTVENGRAEIPLQIQLPPGQTHYGEPLHIDWSDLAGDPKARKKLQDFSQATGRLRTTAEKSPVCTSKMSPLSIMTR